MGSIYVICSRQCPNGDGIYTLLYALYKYSTSITNQPTNQSEGQVVIIIIVIVSFSSRHRGIWVVKDVWEDFPPLTFIYDPRVLTQPIIEHRIFIGLSFRLPRPVAIVANLSM